MNINRLPEKERRKARRSYNNKNKDDNEYIFDFQEEVTNDTATDGGLDRRGVSH